MIFFFREMTESGERENILNYPLEINMKSRKAVAIVFDVIQYKLSVFATCINFFNMQFSCQILLLSPETFIGLYLNYNIEMKRNIGIF